MTLKNYHNNLMTFNSSVYLTIISLVMMAAALMEAFAWGFLASSFVPDNPLIGWLTVGVFVFVLMWTLDRSMAATDLLKNEHSIILNGYDTEDDLGFWQKCWVWIQDHFSFVIRLAIVALSLWITAPFLTQVVFRQDIENGINARYASAIDLAKTNREQAHETTLDNQYQKILALENDIKAINDKLQNEISGKSGTGYGDGPVAQSIKNQLASTERQLQAAHQEKERIIADFKQENAEFFAAIDRADSEALKKYGVHQSKESPKLRQEIINELKTDPAFMTTDRAVHVFLFLVGIILIITKMLQPKSVQLYFSSLLQEKFVQYAAGGFDGYLADKDKSVNALAMYQQSPELFFGLMKDYAKKINAITHFENRKMLDELKRNERIRQMEETEKLRLKQKQQEALLAQEQKQAEIEKAKALHLRHLADEQAKIDHIKDIHTFTEENVEQSLQKLEDHEKLYLQKYQDKIDELEREQARLLEQLNTTERDYHNFNDVLDNLEKQLQTARLELEKIKKEEASIVFDGNNNFEKLRKKNDCNDAISAQKRQIIAHEQNLIDFKAKQEHHEEYVSKIKEELSFVEEALEHLKHPLNIINEQRKALEIHKFNIIKEHGTVEAPFVPHDESELPFLANWKITPKQTILYEDTTKHKDTTKKEGVE